MKMKRTLRIFALLLALCLCAAMVFSLSGCKKEEETLDTAMIDEDEGSTVKYFARIIVLDPDAHERFVAASNGYDIEAEDFDDDNLPEVPEGYVHLEAAKEAMKELRPDSSAADKENFDERLEAMTEADVHAIVEKAAYEVDLNNDKGPIDTILVWIGKFVQIMTKITGGKYVLGLFFFAIVIEILMLPFGIKQQKNTIKQARLRPREMAIRNKYKGRNDQATMQKMQAELQKMYQDEGVNPMAGCLPLLLQLPIIIALYNIVINPLFYVLDKSKALADALRTYCTTSRAAGGLGISLGEDKGKGTIELLSKLKDKGSLEGLKSFKFFENGGDCYEALANNAEIPDFTLFGNIDMGIIPNFDSFNILLLIPVLTFVVYFFSMKITRKLSYQPAAQDPQMGCSNNVMDITMPLMSVVITFMVPAAVGVYWIFKSVISTAKQFIMYKAMPMPVFTEEDYKAAEKALKGKSYQRKGNAAVADGAERKPVRSLHYIDEDDEPLPPTVVSKAPAKKSTPAKKSAPKSNANVPNLKADRKDEDK